MGPPFSPPPPPPPPPPPQATTTGAPPGAAAPPQPQAPGREGPRHPGAAPTFPLSPATPQGAGAALPASGTPENPQARPGPAAAAACTWGSPRPPDPPQTWARRGGKGARRHPVFSRRDGSGGKETDASRFSPPAAAPWGPIATSSSPDVVVLGGERPPLAVGASPEAVEDSSPSAHQKSSHQGLTSVSSSLDVVPPRPHLHRKLPRSGCTAGLRFLPLLPRSGPTRTHLHWLLPRSGCTARPHLLLLLPRSGPTRTSSPSTPPQKWSHQNFISIDSSSEVVALQDLIFCCSFPEVVPPGPHLHQLLP
ncbi:nascent polypeptide-associated complex subunit alpha, muscle-specific form-like [Aquila chrysaetos chrysaetos]|uniref:nascent polypeptide-associated complex subunit alpha, muscle-specific form-like n=1 Tax=Aquila chrysaetos chrysaetos TaxID=223781 RepID=UPI001B7D35F1|nr:nascent polypeptide-associated complex subunit alpha, muscle-specific form-like [Aquila chrysaetos chrysaetos]